MKKQILYLGDTSLNTAASYLAGVMNFYGLDFDYLPSDRKFDISLLENQYQAIIISDYPSSNFSADQLQNIAKEVENGTGLLMIGGWESFTGANCEYNNTILAKVLPVIMKKTDDRINCPNPCLVEKIVAHKIILSLPFDKNPPAIGGFNQLKAKPNTQTILAARRFKAQKNKNRFIFEPTKQAYPLLILGAYGRGRVAVFATDAAPHWVGGLVDWGNKRVTAQHPGANQIEVGNWYAKLLANIINWTAGKV